MNVAVKSLVLLFPTLEVPGSNFDWKSAIMTCFRGFRQSVVESVEIGS
jgi:hypothetical protein